LAGHQPVEQVTVRGEPLLELGAASLRVPASIQVATCTGWTALIAGTPPLAHQP
jgi:hypothetical protein